MPATSPTSKDRRTLFPIVLALGLLSLLLHFYPFLSSNNPLGYDTGFYRRYVTQPYISFPNAEVPGLSDTLIPRLFLDSLRLLHIPTDILLYGSYVSFFVLLPILLFIWLRPHFGTRGAAIAGTLLALSPVQYVGFWYMLWKNALTLSLLLFAFISFERRWLAPLVALDVAIAFSHKTTAAIYLLTLAVLFLIHGKRRKEIFIHGLVTSLAFAAINATAFEGITRSTPVAVFLDWSEYLALSVPLFILALFSIPAFVAKKKKIPATFVAFGFVSILYPILQLPFHERIFIFSDIAIVILAAYGLDYLLSNLERKINGKRSYAFFIIICITIGILLGNLWNEMRERVPLQTDADISIIEDVGKQVPENAIILTTSSEAPWYEGWTQSHIAAPGMLYDMHNLEEWQEIWYATSTEKTIRLLNDFPDPLYISTLGEFKYLIGNRPKCVVDVSPNLLINKCGE